LRGRGRSRRDADDAGAQGADVQPRARVHRAAGRLRHPRRADGGADAEAARLSREGARAREHGRVLRTAAEALRALLRRALRQPEHARAVPRRRDARRCDAVRRRLLARRIARRPSAMGVTAPRYPHSAREAIAAPSTSERSFLNAMSGSTRDVPANVPKPQSVPAITRSRPTISAY